MYGHKREKNIEERTCIVGEKDVSAPKMRYNFWSLSNC